MKKHILFYWLMVVLTLQGCGFIGQQAVQETPTTTQTLTPSATPTLTMTPSRTPQPSRTPNATKTKNYVDIFAHVQKFKEDGLIPSTDGKYMPIAGFDDSFAQMGWLYPINLHYYFKHFVYQGHIAWSTAIDTNETSGCGVVFAMQSNKYKWDYFGVILDKSRIFFSYLQGGYYHDLGKTSGTGRLQFGNPAEADLVLLVYDYKSFVYVNDEFIGEYTLPRKKEIEGSFGYGIISGTNRDYGTKCKITDSRVWQFDD